MVCESLTQLLTSQIDLENAQIPCEVWLEHCQFNASANFNGASFAGTVSFENSAFKADAGFNSMKVGRAVFNDAVFEGPVDFVSADIAGNFEADGARFQNKEKTADFGSMKVGGYASLRCGLRRAGGLWLGRYRQQFGSAGRQVSEQRKDRQLQQHESRRRRLLQ